MVPTVNKYSKGKQKPMKTKTRLQPKRINENTRITLTIRQLRRLINESNFDDDDFQIDDYGVLMMYHGEGGKVIIPDGVKEIWREAFVGCPVSSVTIPDSVKRIGKDAFAGCPLEEIDMPLMLLLSAFANPDYAFSGTPLSEWCRNQKSGLECERCHTRVR